MGLLGDALDAGVGEVQGVSDYFVFVFTFSAHMEEASARDLEGLDLKSSSEERLRSQIFSTDSVTALVQFCHVIKLSKPQPHHLQSRNYNNYLKALLSEIS